MSKNQSRKGYVVGALVALVSTLFTVAPAQADATGPVTLLPTSGTTFNTIIGSPISLVSTQDPSTIISGARSATTSYYIISNPDEALITITYSANASVSGAVGNVYTYTSTGASSASSEAFTGFTASTGTTWKVLQTNLTKIAIPAWTASSVSTVFNTITMDVAGDDTATITVQTLVDYAASGTSQAGIYNQSGFDLVSKEETVTFYAPGDVSATTTITGLVPNQDTVSATVVYGNSVNPFFVAANTYLSIFQNGSLVTLSTSDITADSGKKIKGVITADRGKSISRNVISFGVTSSDFVTFRDALDGKTPPTWSPAIYSAQAYYGASYVTMGAASTALDVSAGASSTMDGISVSHLTTVNSKLTVSTAAATLSARTGTKAIVLSTQIYSGSAALTFANVEVKAVISETDLAAGTTITATGAAGSLATGGDAITAFGRTDTNGKASFTITSNTGAKSDQINVFVYAKNSLGQWVAYTSAETTEAGIEIVWEDASFAASQFTAKPATYVSGANPTVTFKVADQFGQPLSTIAGKTLTVYTVASFGGVENAKSYSGTVVVTNGEAKFTFANFAPAGGLAQLKATLFQGALNDASDIASTSVNVYNTAVTDKVSVVSSFTTDVSYVDYVTGDTSDPTVAAKVSDAGLSTSEGVEVKGNVLNASGVGQPGVAVTVAAKGVLFYADGVYSLDTVTTNANEFGAFSVYAIAHTVYARGTTVSITSDGKTATTLLVTYLPSGLTDDNLKFSWTLPANVVKNTTYAVTLSLTDKWGNPVAGTTASGGVVSVQGLGSVEINSSASAISRNFDKNGQATVFLRSIKDIAGPGSLTATLVTTISYPSADGAAVDSAAIGAFNTVDLKSTAWDESLWSNELTSNIEVLDSAPASTAGKVNVGSFNGKLVVYAQNLDGARISWKVGGNWGTATAVGNTLNRFDRPTPRRGVTVSVEIYVNGVKQLTKSVVTR